MLVITLRQYHSLSQKMNHHKKCSLVILNDSSSTKAELLRGDKLYIPISLILIPLVFAYAYSIFIFFFTVLFECCHSSLRGTKAVFLLLYGLQFPSIQKYQIIMQASTLKQEIQHLLSGSGPNPDNDVSQEVKEMAKRIKFCSQMVAVLRDLRIDIPQTKELLQRAFQTFKSIAQSQKKEVEAQQQQKSLDRKMKVNEKQVNSLSKRCTIDNKERKRSAPAKANTHEKNKEDDEGQVTDWMRYARGTESSTRPNILSTLPNAAKFTLVPSKGKKKKVLHDNEEEDKTKRTSKKQQKKAKIEGRIQMLKEGKQSLWLKYRQELLSLLDNNQVVVICGQISTQNILKHLHEHYKLNHKKIGLSLQSTLAVKYAAVRIRQQLGVEVKQFIQPSDSQRTSLNEVQVVTEKVLLNKLMQDPQLSSYSAFTIAIDEANERLTTTDIILSLIKKLSQQKASTKIIILSVDKDAGQPISTYLDAPILTFPQGQLFQIEEYYADSPSSYIESSVTRIINIYLNKEQGDIACFLPNQESIDKAISILEEMKAQYKWEDLAIFSVYSQDYHEPIESSKKCIFVTRVAVTLLPIQNVQFIIDCGRIERNEYTHYHSMEKPMLVWISKSSQMRRSIYARRVAGGKCYYIFTPNQLKKQDTGTSQIEGMNLSKTILIMKTWKIKDIFGLDIHPKDFNNSKNMLIQLKALDKQEQITALGKIMVGSLYDPRIVKMLMASVQYKCIDSILSICAMLVVRTGVFPKNNQQLGDHFNLLKIWNQWKSEDQSGLPLYLFEQKSLRNAGTERRKLMKILTDKEIDVENPALQIYNKTNIKRCIFQGFSENVASYNAQTQAYMTRDNQMLTIHHSLHLTKQYPVVFHEALGKNKQMRFAIEVEPDWLLEIAPMSSNEAGFENVRESV